MRKNSFLVNSIISYFPVKWEVFLLIFFKRQSCALSLWESPLIKVELFIPLMHCLISDPDRLIAREYVLLRPGKLAAQAVIFLFFLIIKHIDIQISHEAGRAPVV